MYYYKIDEFHKCIKSANEVYIFGTGTYGGIYAKYLKQQHIEFAGFIDNNVNNQGNVIDGKKVYALSDTLKKNVFYLIATAIQTSKVIYNQLRENGVSDERIISFDDQEILDVISYRLIDTVVFDKNSYIKDRYKGKRGFAVGNGPSLTKDVLAKISKEYSFSTNYAYQMVGIEGWKPTGYVLNDSDVVCNLVKNNPKVLTKEYADFIFINALSMINHEEYYNEEWYYFYTKRRRKSLKYSAESDLLNPILDLGTTMHIILQIMMYMGFNEIYLVGMDYRFPYWEDEDGKVVKDEKCNVAHSVLQTEVKGGAYPGGGYAIYWMTRGFEAILKCAEEKNIKIYNVTPNSALTVFEHRDFDMLFKNL